MRRVVDLTPRTARSHRCGEIARPHPALQRLHLHLHDVLRATADGSTDRSGFLADETRPRGRTPSRWCSSAASAEPGIPRRRRPGTSRAGTSVRPPAPGRALGERHYAYCRLQPFATTPTVGKSTQAARSMGTSCIRRARTRALPSRAGRHGRRSSPGHGADREDVGPRHVAGDNQHARRLRTARPTTVIRIPRQRSIAGSIRVGCPCGPARVASSGTADREHRAVATASAPTTTRWPSRFFANTACVAGRPRQPGRSSVTTPSVGHRRRWPPPTAAVPGSACWPACVLQGHEIGDTELGIVGGFTAHLGPEAQVAPEQRRHGRAAGRQSRRASAPSTRPGSGRTATPGLACLRSTKSRTPRIWRRAISSSALAHRHGHAAHDALVSAARGSAGCPPTSGSTEPVR